MRLTSYAILYLGIIAFCFTGMMYQPNCPMWALVPLVLVSACSGAWLLFDCVEALGLPPAKSAGRATGVGGIQQPITDKDPILAPALVIARALGYCIRKHGHDGPCNGWPRKDCNRMPGPVNASGAAQEHTPEAK